MTDLPRDFAARVRAARNYTDGVPSQEDFGRMVGVSGGTIKNYENGGSVPPDRSRRETMRRLAAASKLPEWFFTAPDLGRVMMRGEGSSDALSQLLDEVQALRAELASTEAEVLRRIDELQAPSEGSQNQQR